MRTRTTILLIVVGLLATACFKSETRIRVNEDGSGEIESLIALDVDAALELGNAFGTEDVPGLGADEACDDFEQQQDVPEGATVRPYEEDGFCGVSYTLAFAPDEFQSAMTAAATGGQVELRRDGGGWFFESVFTNESLGGDDLGTDFFPEGILDDAEVSIGVFLPGRQVEHNASYVDTDGTFVWELDLNAETERIFARTEAGETVLGSGGQDDDGGSAILGLIVIIVLLALIAGVVWLIVRRRRGPDGAAQPTGSASGMPPEPIPAPSSTLPPPPPR